MNLSHSSPLDLHYSNRAMHPSLLPRKPKHARDQTQKQEKTKDRERSEDWRLTLSGLPAELLHEITDHLGLADAVFLSQCSHTFLYKLGSSAMRKLHSNNEQRCAYLQRIREHYPGYLLCGTCGTYHVEQYAGLLRIIPRSYKFPPCQRELNDTKTHTQHFFYLKALDHRVSYLLTFGLVRFVMERHRHGQPYGVPLDTLEFTEVRTARSDHARLLTSVEPKIIEDQLFLRVQQCVAYHEELDDDSTIFESLAFCAHIHGPNRAFVESLVSHNDPSGNHGGVSRHPASHMMCGRCQVEIEVSSWPCAPKWHGYIITRWLHLGAGLTDSDQSWQRHVRWYRTVPSMIGPGLLPLPIRKRFEKHDPAGVCTKTFENKMTLMHQQYRHGPFQSLGSTSGLHDVWVKHRDVQWLRPYSSRSLMTFIEVSASE